MGDRMPPPNAWRPIHQPNTGTSFNAGFHGMGPPSMPRSGDMALPINAVSINSRILEDISPSSMIIFFFKSYNQLKCFSLFVLCRIVALFSITCCLDFAFVLPADLF